ncbi:ATP-grasp domain-containing protein [Chitinimonas sp.]|uniref:ATP-grasp domain-containing protein n=1 Tax=Chitinimonas sp. TaxID=1934313 RepID=UPI0035B0FAAE
MRTVLLGAAGTGTAFAIASRLKAIWGNGIRLIASDVNSASMVSTSLLADAYHQVPYANSPLFEGCIVDLLRDESVNHYIPILNEEIVLAGELADNNVYSHIDFWSSMHYAKCVDKKYASQWLNSIGISTPKDVRIADIECEERRVFVKPRDGFGSRKAQVMTLGQVKALPFEEQEALVIQELCDGPEVTVDSFWDAQKGRGYIYCRERLEVKAGVCTKARLFYCGELAKVAERIATEMSQHGTICFQVMKFSGAWVVTDLNLRPGAGTAMTCAAGFDVLAAAFACRTGGDYSRYVKPLVEGEEYIITRQYVEFVTRHSVII